MAEERKVTEEFEAASGGVGAGGGGEGGGAGTGGEGAGGVVKLKDEDDGPILFQPPWYQRLWGCIAAAGRWLWKFWWLWLLIVLVVAAAVAAYFIFAGNGEEKAPVAGKTAVVAPATPGVTGAAPAPATGLLTSPDATSAMAAATEERLGKVEEVLKSAPAAVPGAASVVVVDQAQWISQCVSWGGTDAGCKKRLELLRVR